MRLLAIARTLRPVDVLLPVGAALVAAGLHQLAQREERQQHRLRRLRILVDAHRDTLVSAGVEVPEDLAAEPESLDEAVPWLGIVAGGHAPAPEPAAGDRPAAPRRPWKLAAVALVAAGTITLMRHRDAIAAAVAERLGDDPGTVWGQGDLDPEPHPHSGVRVDATQLDDPEILERDDLADDPVPAAGAEPLESCGWPNCDWTSDPERSEMGQRTQAAVHRNKCVYRPAGANVPG